MSAYKPQWRSHDMETEVQTQVTAPPEPRAPFSLHTLFLLITAGVTDVKSTFLSCKNINSFNEGFRLTLQMLSVQKQNESKSFTVFYCRKLTSKHLHFTIQITLLTKLYYKNCLKVKQQLIFHNKAV